MAGGRGNSFNSSHHPRIRALHIQVRVFNAYVIRRYPPSDLQPTVYSLWPVFAEAESIGGLMTAAVVASSRHQRTSGCIAQQAIKK
jgi:hypothetical protein